MLKRSLVRINFIRQNINKSLLPSISLYLTKTYLGIIQIKKDLFQIAKYLQNKWYKVRNIFLPKSNKKELIAEKTQLIKMPDEFNLREYVYSKATISQAAVDFVVEHVEKQSLIHHDILDIKINHAHLTWVERLKQSRSLSQQQSMMIC